MKQAIAHRPVTTGGGGESSSDPYWNDVVLMLKFDGTNGSTTFTDSSNAPHTANNNAASLSTSVKQYGTASLNCSNGDIYFVSPDFAVEGGDFTLEGWFNLNAAGGEGADRGLFQLCSSVAPSHEGFEVGATSGTDKNMLYMGAADTGWSGTLGSALSTGAWHHVALTRQSGTCRLFCDGTLIYTYTDTRIFQGTFLLVGCAYGLGWATRGYVDSFRFTKGVARYIATVTVPSDEFPTTAAADDSYTSVLMHFDGNWTDEKGSTPVVGSAALLADSGRYGKGSAYFNATSTNAYAKIPPYNDNLNFGSSDFTIECNVFAPSFTGSLCILAMGLYGTENHMALNCNAGALQLWFNPTGSTGGGQGILSSTTAPVVNMWNHVAIVKYSGVFTLYINGVSSGTYTDAVGPWNTATGLFLASYAQTTHTNNALCGIDELRVSKVARYTANFTPPGAFAPNGVSFAPYYDPFKDYVQVIAHMDNSGADVKGHTISGSPAFTASKSKFGGYALTAYYNLVTNADPAILLGDYTIEFFFYHESMTDWQWFISEQSNNFDVALVPNRNYLYAYVGSNNFAFQMTEPAFNQWHHIAVVRKNGQLSAFINGNQIGTAQGAASYSVAAADLRIGSQFNGNYPLGGTRYMDEVRITAGARYSGAFAPPMQPFQCLMAEFDPYYANVVLHLRADGNAVDQKWHSVTFASPSYVGGRFGQAFNFSGSNYVSVANSSDFNFNTGDFTIECWFKGNTTASGYTDRFFSLGNNGVAGAMGIVLNGSGYVRVDHATNTILTGTVAVTDNSWHHIAVTRASGTVLLFVDGTQQASATYSSSLSFTTPLEIGEDSSLGTSSCITGALDDIRITNGVARYTANFTAPTTPFAVSDLSYSTVRFLMHADSAIQDVKGHSIINNSVTVSTSYKKFGAGSAAFNGSAYLQSMGAGALGSGDFTVEGFFYLTTKTTGYPCIFNNYSSFGAGSLGFFAGHGSSNSAKYQLAVNGTFPAVQSTSDIVYNVWQHFAVVRSSGTIKLYINGAEEGSCTNSANLTGSGSLFIGTCGDSISGGYINGYIDEMQIVVGTARYLSAFTPPAAPFTEN
jgi:hypothetical protein